MIEMPNEAFDRMLKREGLETAAELDEVRAEIAEGADETPGFRDMDEEAGTPVVLPERETGSYQIEGESFRRDHRGVPILEARADKEQS